MSFFFYYTNCCGQIIFLACNQLMWSFFPISVIYKEELNLNTIAEKLLLTGGFMLVATIFAMVLLYISSLHVKMQLFNVENNKLLDGMHEGLLIMSKSNKEIMFCNKPSQKFLEGVLYLIEP